MSHRRRAAPPAGPELTTGPPELATGLGIGPIAADECGTQLVETRSLRA